MIGALLRLQFRALFGSIARKNRGGTKGAGTVALLLLIPLLAVSGVMTLSILFSTLLDAYHPAGLDWLYFAMAGLMALALSVFGSVFLAQSTLYNAKDNDALLSMPIPPRLILLSRMIPLLAYCAVFIWLVLGTAVGVYAVKAGLSFAAWMCCLLSAINLPLMSLAIICLLGWGLNLIMGRMNKTLASVIYTALFLGIYFYIYFQAGPILNSLAGSGASIAGTLQLWVWPLYAMGRGCAGDFGVFCGFPAITLVLFVLVYWFLSVTFLRNARKQHIHKRRRMDLKDLRVGSVSKALGRKELYRFLGSPVYLTNMGLGVLMVAAIGVAGLIFREKVLWFISLLPELTELAPLMLCGMVGFLATTTCVSAPSVSMEGKNLWILKALPVSPREILRAKLRFHCLLTMPVSAAAGLVLSMAYGFGVWDIVLCTLCPGLLSFLCGVLGMVSGLRWARLDWTNEVGPVKQSTAVLVAMLGMMGVIFVNGFACYLLYGLLTPTQFLVVVCLELAAASACLYRIMLNWGARKWESL